MKNILLAGLFLVGISTFSNANEKGITVKTSGFDGVKEVSLKPYGSSSCLSMKQTCISVGAMWKSDLSELVGLDIYALRDLVLMSDLLINIDGEIIKAAKVSQASGFNTVGMYKESFQRFAIKKTDFEKLISAQRVWLKINRTDGSYIETYLIGDGKDTLAHKALLRFSKSIE